MTPEDEFQKLRTTVRQVAHELGVWSLSILDDDGFFAPHEELSARLAALGKTLMDALERHSDPDKSVETPG